MSKFQIDLGDLPVKRLRRLAAHLFENSEARLKAADRLYDRLSKIAEKCPPAIADEMLALRDEWKGVNDHIAQSSNKAVRNITNTPEPTKN